MEKRRLITVVIGAALCSGAIVAAQGQPLVTHADKVVVEKQWGPSGQTAPTTVQTTLTGNVLIEVNGVVVRADRAVIRDGEVTLDGNVRLTLSKPVYSAAAMRSRIDTSRITRIDTPDVPSRPQQIDTPIPQPWQPPPRNQR